MTYQQIKMSAPAPKTSESDNEGQYQNVKVWVSSVGKLDEELWDCEHLAIK
jgi:hypothetical protein